MTLRSAPRTASLSALNACLRAEPRRPLIAPVTLRLPAEFYADRHGKVVTAAEMVARVHRRMAQPSLPRPARVSAVVEAR